MKRLFSNKLDYKSINTVKNIAWKFNPPFNHYKVQSLDAPIDLENYFSLTEFKYMFKEFVESIVDNDLS
jgi:hypothetical protein